MWSTRRCAGHAVPRDRASRAAGPFTAAPDSIQLEVVFLPISVLAVRKQNQAPRGIRREGERMLHSVVDEPRRVGVAQVVEAQPAGLVPYDALHGLGVGLVPP